MTQPTSGRWSSTRIMELVCALAVLVLPWLVFWPVTIGAQVFGAGDIAAYHHPLMVAGSEQWRTGQAPLWNPYLYGGTPLAAAQQASVFYPLNIALWLLFPPWLMLGYGVLLHLSLTGLSVFALLRSVKAHPLAALLGGVTFALSGFALGHLGHVNIIRAMPWAGFALWGFNRWAATRKGGYLGAIAVATALLLMSGYPQVIAYSMLLIFSYPLFMAVRAGRDGRKLFLTGLLPLFLGAGLGAIQTIPTAVLWFTQEYLRPGLAYYDFFVGSSLHPAYLVTLLFPRARSGTFAEMVVYAGVAPFLLAIMGIATARKDRASWFRWFFIAWLVLSLVLSLGRYVPPLAELLFTIPVYQGLAVPSRHLLEFALSFAVLAGLGLDWLLREPEGAGQQVLTWRKAALFLALLGAWVVFSAISPFAEDNPPLRLEPTLRALGQPLLLLLLGLGFLVGIRRAKGSVQVGLTLLLILITAADLSDQGAGLCRRHLWSPHFYQDAPSTARVMARENDREGPTRIVAFEAQGNVMDQDLAKELLGANFNMAYSVESVIGLDGLMLDVVSQASGEVIRPWGFLPIDSIKDQLFRVMLDLRGVRHLLVRAENAKPLTEYYEPVATVEGVTILRNERARPRLYPLVAAETTGQGFSSFGGRVTLQNYGLAETEATADSPAERVLHTWWSCAEAIEKDYTLYVHYVDGAGNTLAQADFLLGARSPEDVLPTSQWLCPGTYRNASPVPPELTDTGALDVALGLWIPETGEHLAPTSHLPVDGAGRVRLEITERSPGGALARPVLTDEMDRMWMVSVDPERDLAAVDLVRYEGDRLAADVALEEKGILVHGTNYVSGWRATVDGEPTPVLKIGGFLQGIEVPQGKHRVEFWYEPDSVKWGAAITAFFLVLTAVLPFLPWQRWLRPGVRDR